MNRQIVINFYWNPAWDRRLGYWGLVACILAISPLEIGSESLTLQTYYPSPLGIYTNMTTTGPTLLARDGGNVGIGTGTSAPQYPLDVNGGSAVPLQLKSSSPTKIVFSGTGPNILKDNAGGGFSFNTGTAADPTIMMINYNGVGIKTHYPGSDLQVNGQAIFGPSPSYGNIPGQTDWPTKSPVIVTGPGSGISMEDRTDGAYERWNLSSRNDQFTFWQAKTPLNGTYCTLAGDCSVSSILNPDGHLMLNGGLDAAGAIHTNSNLTVDGSLSTNGSFVANGLSSTGGPIYTAGNAQPPGSSQGVYINWNGMTGGSGETDFFNNKGGGPGGFAFYNADNSGILNGGASKPLVYINRYGDFYFHNNSSQEGFKFFYGYSSGGNDCSSVCRGASSTAACVAGWNLTSYQPMYQCSNWQKDGPVYCLCADIGVFSP